MSMYLFILFFALHNFWLNFLSKKFRQPVARAMIPVIPAIFF